MNITKFIGTKLDYCLIDNKKIIKKPCICKMCGDKTDFGVSNLITASFTDASYLKKPEQELLCKNCAACLGKVISPHNGKPTFFRNFSFLADETEIRLLRREDIMDIMLNPPVGRFVLCVTYSNKKHIAFKARIQTDRDQFTVFTDKGPAEIIRKKLSDVVSVIQPLYTVCKNTKQQPTYFSKTDILTGCDNLRKIEEYGIEKYFNAESRIKNWRGTAWFRLSVFALNKNIPDVEGRHVIPSTKLSTPFELTDSKA